MSTYTHNPYSQPGYVCINNDDDALSCLRADKVPVHLDDADACYALSVCSDDRTMDEEPLDTDAAHHGAPRVEYPSVSVLRTDLIGHCPFVAYPAHTYGNSTLRPSAPYPRPAGVVQLFLGQVPFRITDGQLLFLFETLAGVNIQFIERVVQGESRKGCIQLFADETSIEAAQRAIHKRVLFDEFGFWFATNWDELNILQAHCQVPEWCRHRGMPFNCAVLEQSTSTYTLAVAQYREAEERAQRAKNFGARLALRGADVFRTGKRWM